LLLSRFSFCTGKTEHEYGRFANVHDSRLTTHDEWITKHELQPEKSSRGGHPVRVSVLVRWTSARAGAHPGLEVARPERPVQVEIRRESMETMRVVWHLISCRTSLARTPRLPSNERAASTSRADPLEIRRHRARSGPSRPQASAMFNTQEPDARRVWSHNHA
jgi:hypothetical protein